ncbi:hypothetical protein MCEME20_00503 [Candidatus Pelagibacterales bacterium]
MIRIILIILIFLAIYPLIDNGASKFINDFHLQKLPYDFREYFLDTLINISAELQNILTKIRKG